MVARTDLTTDPAVAADLLNARHGTAYFSRKLSELSDEQLRQPSLLDGWSRSHVVAHVGYNARALTRLVGWANTGVETPMYESTEARDYEINFGATLPPIALRNLNEHAAITLNVEWRDTPDDAWSNEVRTIQGRVIPLSETPWLRSREVWVHAVDLGNGGRFADVPVTVLTRLLREISGAWTTRGEHPAFGIAATDAAVELPSPVGKDLLRGSLADLTAWATGRATPAERARLSLGGGDAPVAPRWL
jgi:maleylpyruvate isomerase